MRRRSALGALGMLLLLSGGGATVWATLGEPAPVSGDRAIPDRAAVTKPFVLAVLGTSLTAASKWPETLVSRLEKCLGTPVTLVRAAVSGANSETGLAQIEQAALAKPDLVLMEFSINDADLRDGVWLARSQRLHREMIERLADLSPASRVALVTMSPAHGPRSWIRLRLSAYEAMYRRLADTLPVGLIDLAPDWRAAMTKDVAGSYMPDGLHPTETAVNEIALPRLLERTGAVFGGSCHP